MKLPFAAGDDLLDTTEAAACLGRSTATVKVLIREGNLPAVRIGQRWLISQGDLDAFVQATHRRAPGGYRQAAAKQAEDRALQVVAERPGITVVELAAITGATRRTALSRLQYLARQGWIVRMSNGPTEPHHCELTNAGWERCRSVLPELPLAKPA